MLPLVPAPHHVEVLGDRAGARVEADVAVQLDPALGPERYLLDTTATTPAGVRVGIRAGDEAGVLRARATLAQLALAAVAGHYPAVRIEDGPRFAHRGFMLDVARHFFGVETILEVLDLMAELKVNVLHLHLTDDQGWRIAVDARPELTGFGAATQCGGARPEGAGFLTRADYRAIQDHAASLGITVVPEVDVPGHTNAALVAYPELAIDGVHPEPYEGTEVGFSQLDARNEATYRFWNDVVTQLAADTDGPFLHLGGDEALAMTEEDYLDFLARAFEIVAATGKRPMAWHEAGRSEAVPAQAVGQYWNFVRPRTAQEDRFGIDHADRATGFVRQGGSVVLSPADAVYLDHRQADGGPGDPGVDWVGGPVTLRASYEWEPTAVLAQVPPEAVLGVEATLFTETVATREELFRLLLPRLAAVAEVAWSAPARDGGTPVPRQLADLTPRLALLGADWTARGLPFTRSAEVPWSVPTAATHDPAA